ncbi:hypothetical protein PN499_11590 [Kamptonema animale CS-326]|nr:hypothetical protein [Kamptonema animale]MDB9511829.1 hypothetical protein [Kamptonema animale CS-326]
MGSRSSSTWRKSTNCNSIRNAAILAVFLPRLLAAILRSRLSPELDSDGN